jgi:hypothetical protein
MGRKNHQAADKNFHEGTDSDKLLCRKRISAENPTCQKEAKRYLPSTMPALVIKSFPEDLHAKLRKIAVAHRRSITQETIHLIETAIAVEEKTAPINNPNQSKWANRKTIPGYDAMIKAGAFSGGTDSTQIISEERDAR